MNYIKDLEEVIADIIDEERFNSPPSRVIGAIERRIETLLMGEYRAGKLKGRTHREAFFVYCTDRDADPLEFEIGIALHKPVQFFKINLRAF